MASLRQALEHVGDAEWLRTHSPIATAWIDSTPPQLDKSLRPPSIGIKQLDDRLQAIWQDWETRSKTPLQTMLWSVTRQINADRDQHLQSLLLLTYFQDPRPKQGDLIKQLAVGQSTFYRQISAAVEALERAVIAHLQPSLRLEAPVSRPLVGRDVLLHDGMAALRAGGVVSFVGASGLGKTSLAATLADQWRETAPVFWYTIRPDLTDNPYYLLYSLALFLHQCGTSNLWLHLIAKPQEISLGKALAMIRKSLEDLAPAPPLLCFDEVDFLLPEELDDWEGHQQMRAFLEDLGESQRGGAPILFVGQRLLLAPDRGNVFSLTRLAETEIQVLLTDAGLVLHPETVQRVAVFTRGNPLLLQLLVALHQLGEPVVEQLALLTSTVSLDWFLARLRRHLSDPELNLLDKVCVFDAPAPANLWRKETKVVDRLVQLCLIERDSGNQIVLPPALREAFYRRLAPDLRAELHLAAAQGCVEHGQFTLGARHFCLGQQPEMAVWIWRAHRDEELQQGQLHTALGIFAALQGQPLATDEDGQALRILLADLNHLVGKHADGLAALDARPWPSAQRATARAHELRGQMLAMRGDIEQSLREYRASLDMHDALNAAKPIRLRVEMARQMHVRARDIATAQREAMHAKLDAELLLGQIEEDAGQLEQARARYLDALTLARASNDAVRLAKTCELLGILEARCLNVDTALTFLTEAGGHYQSYGNTVCAVGMTKSNIAFTYLMARRYRDAVTPLQEAIVFFESVQQPYYLALGQANLAEAFVNLGDADQAEPLAWLALAHEETSIRPNCLYVLAHVRRLQHRYSDAIVFAQDAITEAETIQDPWAGAYALRALADIYRDWAMPDEALRAHARARSAFEQLGLDPD